MSTFRTTLAALVMPVLAAASLSAAVTFLSTFKSINAGGGTISATGTQHPFTMALGGGLDISLSHRIAIRPIEIDYMLSRYSNPLTSTGNQNNFRYNAGIVFKF